eukprot:scaffold316_cov352-Pavlova_lutheri.AAC.30
MYGPSKEVRPSNPTHHNCEGFEPNGPYWRLATDTPFKLGANRVHWFLLLITIDRIVAALSPPKCARINALQQKPFRQDALHVYMIVLQSNHSCKGGWIVSIARKLKQRKTRPRAVWA